MSFLSLPRYATGGVLILALLALLPACGSNGRHSVSGTVTYDGKPMVYGTIAFDPDTSKGVSGPQGSAEIRDGQYRTRSEFAPIAGAHKVRITGWNTSPEKGMVGAPLVNNYIVEVEVPLGGGKLDFNIPDQQSTKSK
jgi:hypothetical protein